MDVKQPLIETNEQETNQQTSIRSPSSTPHSEIPPIKTEMTFSAPLPPIHDEGHELQRRNSKGFQKLESNEPSRSNTPQNSSYYSPPPGQPYYGSPPPGQPGQPQYGSPPPGPPGQPQYGLPPPGQPYYSQTPPPGSQPYYGQPQYPLIQTLEVLPPRGYNRPFYLRMLIGPIQTPIFSYISAIAMAAMLIYEFVKYHNLTGNIIQTNPFNPMIGPSFQVTRTSCNYGRGRGFFFNYFFWLLGFG